MADLDVRHGGGGGGRGYNRKRRFRADDDDHDHRPQRRRYEEPVAVKLRRQLLGIAESQLSDPQDEIRDLARAVTDNIDDERVKETFYDLVIQLVLEQPLKIPFAAAVVLYANETAPIVAREILSKAGTKVQELLNEGDWRGVKLILRLLAYMQVLFQGDGLYPVLDELFNQAVDLQTASSEDVVGLELVKIILLTIPYIIASAGTSSQDKAMELLEKTDIIASTPHSLDGIVEAYPGDSDDRPFIFESLIGLLQRQLQAEAADGWKLACIPRLYKRPASEESTEPPDPANKHPLPTFTVPSSVNPGPNALFPEAYYTLYGDQDVQTIPKTTDIASSLCRDCLVDTINTLSFNRVATAKILIEMDAFWTPGTFAKRATPYDKLRTAEADTPTWKPEDLAVDAVFSQIFKLPSSEHKLVYYHSLITEACKIAPAAVAPSLGRAIRFLFRNVHVMDLELSYRFMDWFGHHLSNFEFRWKWTEWIDDINLPDLHPKKAFIRGALDKEIRLSFAKRIRETLPEVYHPLIPPGKDKDIPDFKYASDQTPYAPEGREILALIRKRAPDEEIQQVIDTIHAQAAEQGESDVLVSSTDAFVTSICFVGSKSLSHVLSCIERCKERLLNIGPQSEAARRQIIEAVSAYWRDQPGIAVNIVDKLLNYTILTPLSVAQWALGPAHRLAAAGGGGAALSDPPLFEMVQGTVAKVTGRVRQIRAARLSASSAALPADQRAMLDDTLARERAAMRALLATIDDAVAGVASGSADAFLEADLAPDDAALVRLWGERWTRVFRRKAAVEEAIVGEAAVAAGIAAGEREAERVRLEAEERERVETAKKAEEEQAAAAAAEAEVDADMANGAAANGVAAEAEAMDEDDIA